MTPMPLHRRWSRPRSLIRLGALLFMTAALAFALMPWQKEVPVRMSIPALTRSAPFYVAMDKGFFRNEGVRVEVTVPTTGKAGADDGRRQCGPRGGWRHAGDRSYPGGRSL
jgi:ABC-type nitrate/sulfonate/bicarbonate transport system substrate-binding protein